MSSILTAAIRTSLQSWWGIAAGWLASLGITISDEQSVVVLGLLTAVGIGFVTAAIRWLETREGDGWERWARKLAAVLMLGMSGAQPTYQSASSLAQPGSKTTKPAGRPRPVTLSVDTQSVTPEMAEAMKRASRL